MRGFLAWRNPAATSSAHRRTPVRGLRHSALEAEAENKNGNEAHQGCRAIGVAARGNGIQAGVLKPFGQGRNQTRCEDDTQGVERRTESDHAPARGFRRIVVLDRGGHGCNRRHAHAEDEPAVHQVNDFRGPGIHGVAESDQSDAQHDDRSPADAVGQHPAGPDQQQGDDLGHHGELPGNGPGNALVRDPNMLGEDVGLGKVHVRHHPDADQGCVHVGPEMPDRHTRCELDLPYARAGAAVNVDHRMVPLVPPPSYTRSSGLLRSCGNWCRMARRRRKDF